MNILALDFATSTGCARGVPGGTPILTTINFGGREHDTDADMFARVTLWIERLLREEPPDLLAIEAPVPLYDKTLQQGFRGIVLGRAACERVRVREVEVGAWRKYVLGHGNLKGSIAKARCVELCTRLRWELPRSKRGVASHDAAEAAGIWLWACSQVDPKNAVRHEPLFAYNPNNN